MTDFSAVRGIYGNMVMSGRWVKNATYPSNSINNGDVIVGKMSAKAVLICRPNSHPFQDRTLILDQPVKIGRSVARARAATNNAIFDCKVLSRNHALLWYENGKFFLQDTKSSNGTFINNQRLSKGAEESPPREVCSGDIVQFGVDVMENSRKVTHGCIVATLKLYLPDGKEAKASPSTSVVNSLGAIPLEDLYQLSQYLQEALQREQVLENKLIALQSLLESTKDAADLSWKALIDEDRLLSRVEILESQLLVYSKNFQEDKLREELQKLLEDKDRYQGTAKESLKKIVDEKLEAIQKLQDLERMLDTTQTEYVNLHELCEKNQLNIQDLAQKYGQQLVKVEELYSQLQMAEEEHREEIERLQIEKKELLERLNERNKEDNEILDDVINNDSQTDNPDIQSYTHTNQSNNENIDSNITKESIKSVDLTDSELILDDTLPGHTSQIDLNQSTQEDVDKLQHLLNVSEHELKISEDEIQQVRTQLDDARHQASFFCDRVIKLEDRIYELETQLKLAERQLSEEKYEEDSSERETEEKTSQDIEVLKGEISSLEELLEEARAKVQYYEQEVSRYQQECEHATIRMKKATDESYLLKEQLEAAKEELHQKGSSLKMMQEKSRTYQSTAENAVRLLTHLKDSLKNEEQSRNLLQEMENLRKVNTELQQNAKQSRNEAEQAKSRFEAALLEAETKYSQLLDEYQAVKAEWSIKFKELENKIEQQSKRNNDLRDHTPEYESLKLKEVESGGGDSYKSEERNEERRTVQSHHTVGTSEIEKISSLEEDLAMYKQSFSQLMEQNAYLHRTTTSLQEELDKRSRNIDIVFAGFILLVAMCVGFVPYYLCETFGFI